MSMEFQMSCCNDFIGKYEICTFKDENSGNNIWNNNLFSNTNVETSFLDFDVWFWNCTDRVVFFFIFFFHFFIPNLVGTTRVGLILMNVHIVYLIHCNIWEQWISSMIFLINHVSVESLATERRVSSGSDSPPSRENQPSDLIWCARRVSWITFIRYVQLSTD